MSDPSVGVVAHEAPVAGDEHDDDEEWCGSEAVGDGVGEVGVGGRAEFVARPRNAEQLSQLARACHEHQIPLRVLGKGANLLVCEGLIAGVTVRLDEMKDVHIDAADGKVIAVAHKEAVSLIEAATKREIRRFLGHSDTVSAVAFSPDGKALATGGDLQSGFRFVDQLPRSYDVDGILLARPFKIVRIGPVRPHRRSDLVVSDLHYARSALADDRNRVGIGYSRGDTVRTRTAGFGGHDLGGCKG